MALIFVLSACGNTNKNPDDNLKTVFSSQAEIEANDFVYRLSTEIDVYDEFRDTAKNVQ